MPHTFRNKGSFSVRGVHRGRRYVCTGRVARRHLRPSGQCGRSGVHGSHHGASGLRRVENRGCPGALDSRRGRAGLADRAARLRSRTRVRAAAYFLSFSEKICEWRHWSSRANAKKPPPAKQVPERVAMRIATLVLTGLVTLLLPFSARAQEKPGDVKGLYLLTDYPAVTVRPGTTSTVSLRLQNYGLAPERLSLKVD